MAPLTSLHDARAAAIALGSAAATAVETVPIAEAAGRIAAEQVIVPIALPRFDGSAMDGYAVRAADLAGATADAPAVLRLVDESRAGHPTDAVLGSGEAMRISTGARVPAGADAVVRVEDADEADGVVRVRVALASGHDIRPAGEDVQPGEHAVAAGDLLHPGRIALLGGIGVASVAVRRPPSVTVVATGDEVVVAGGGALGAGDVHDVNGVAIPALLRAAGAGEVRVVRVGDDREATIAAFRDAGGDLIVSCGGVSVGRHDHVRPALEALGARQAVFGVALQPGKPTWIGTLAGGEGGAAEGGGGSARPVFGLPGNPASAFVTAALFVAPALRAMLGRPPEPVRRGRLVEDAPRDGRRMRALRAVVVLGEDATLGVRILGPQHSHRLRPLADGDLLAIVPPGEGPLPAGSLVELVAVPGATSLGA
ncbi:gephyrin-like molybdotransferase Glp [Patulibacter medicamentivorans]|uniref:molybdopterin molybdotransferase MoeA n=1 Tax=Patulibacter medicamentivorans TaxID=1097667 RepID=UPI0006834706|nr:gephyrin-like molybdotransferase Glp [Patulibacter medicamentivorans]